MQVEAVILFESVEWSFTSNSWFFNIFLFSLTSEEFHFFLFVNHLDHNRSRIVMYSFGGYRHCLKPT